MIDLSKAKPGDTLKLRCGGEIVVPEDWKKINTSYLTDSCPVSWYCNGRVLNAYETPFDIVEAIPAPFISLDWSTVKPGAAFMHKGDRVFFVGWTNIFKNSFNERLVAVEHEHSKGLIFTTHPSNLTRAPEYDVEVQR